MTRIERDSKRRRERVAKMYEEVFEGMCYSNQEIADMFRKNFVQDSTENSQDMVLVKNIEIFSYCRTSSCVDV